MGVLITQIVRMMHLPGTGGGIPDGGTGGGIIGGGPDETGGGIGAPMGGGIGGGIDPGPDDGAPERVGRMFMSRGMS